jgi:hypothetical protein
MSHGVPGRCIDVCSIEKCGSGIESGVNNCDGTVRVMDEIRVSFLGE